MNNDTITWDDVHDEEHDTTEHYRYISNDDLQAKFAQQATAVNDNNGRRTIPIGDNNQLPDKQFLKYRRPRF